MRRRPLAAVLALLSAALVLGRNALLDAGWGGSALRAGLWTAECGASTIPTRVSGGQHG